jgi:hypothetical protein
MEKTLAEKINEYRSQYLIPLIFYTKRDKNGGLGYRVDCKPTFLDHVIFTALVIKEIVVRLSMLPFKQHTLEA